MNALNPPFRRLSGLQMLSGHPRGAALYESACQGAAAAVLSGAGVSAGLINSTQRPHPTIGGVP